MGAPAKTVEVGGLLLKVETTYGTSVAQSASTDGVLMHLTDRFALGAPATLVYKGDGNAGLNPGNIGPRKRLAKSGRALTMPIPHQFKGAGAAYSATVTPSCHTLMRIAGFSGAVTTTIGSEKWVYTPEVPATYSSASGTLYARRESWTFTGGLCNWSMTADGPVAPTHTFDLSAIGAIPTDASLASITYPALTTEPPIASAITFVLGSFLTAEVLKFGFQLGRNLSTERVNLTSSAAHQGFYPAGYDPVFTVTLEQSAFVGSPYHTSSGFDPYQLEANATAFASSIVVGSTQYNKWKLDFPQVQVRSAKPSNNNGIATVDLELVPYATTPIANDFMTVTFD